MQCTHYPSPSLRITLLPLSFSSTGSAFPDPLQSSASPAFVWPQRRLTSSCRVQLVLLTWGYLNKRLVHKLNSFRETDQQWFKSFFSCHTHCSTCHTSSTLLRWEDVASPTWTRLLKNISTFITQPVIKFINTKWCEVCLIHRFGQIYQNFPCRHCQLMINFWLEIRVVPFQYNVSHITSSSVAWVDLHAYIYMNWCFPQRCCPD